jgi:hypothetical protein
MKAGRYPKQGSQASLFSERANKENEKSYSNSVRLMVRDHWVLLTQEPDRSFLHPWVFSGQLGMNTIVALAVIATRVKVILLQK